jgi:hypothetical protein
MLAVAGAMPLADARPVFALGWRRPSVIAWSAGTARVLAGGLDERGTFAAGDLVAAIAFDADGDCDDDILIAHAGGPPALWLRDGDDGHAELAGAVGSQAAALAAADVDGDGDLDLATGAGATLAIHKNDGTGRFSEDAVAIPAGLAADVTALAFADVNGDGGVDLIVGQGGSGTDHPNLLLVNDGSASGRFTPSTAAPATPGRTVALAAGDADADGDADVVVARAGQPLRLWINRGDGRLEDRSFVRLPNVDPLDAVSVAMGVLDGGCLPHLAHGVAARPRVVLRGPAPGV